MSAEIDERIVELRFDNEQFEDGVNESLSTLDKLKKALDIDGSTSLSYLQIAVDKTANSFSALEQIAAGALENIGIRIEQTGERLLNSMTLDQIGAGWGKFEEKTKAVQTIMSATGESIDVVNGYLEKLMWFTDETSYNFVDMTSNIGKFTAQQIPLDRATNSMIGIANWAALAGQGANEASRAMYNLAQSLGAGYVKYQDWMSVINANMDIAQFKERVIEVAKELGTLDEAAKTTSGNLVSIETFGENLTQDKWFTSDVLIKVLEEYGEYANIVYEATQATGEATSDVMAALEGMYEGVGEKAFKAGQEAKTFSDVLDATADAVSSAWLTMFETIFGNYEEAKIMWTDLANGLYDIFAEPINARNELLALWKEAGGRDVFLEGVYALASKLVDVLDAVSAAWTQVFPPTSLETLLTITEQFRLFWTNLELTEPAAEAVHNILTGLFSVLKLGVDVVKSFVISMSPMLNVLNEFLGNIVVAAGDVGLWITNVVESAVITEKASGIFDVFGQVLTTVTKIVTGAADGFKYLAEQVQYVGGEIFNRIAAGFNKLAAIKSEIPMTETLDAFLSTISKFASEGGLKNLLIGTVEAFSSALITLMDATKGANEGIFNILSTIAAFSFGSNFSNVIKGLNGVINNLKGIFSIGGISKVTESVDKFFGSLTGAINQFKKNGGVTYYIKMAASITAIAIAMKILSSIDTEKLIIGGAALKTMFKMMESFTSKLSGLETNVSGMIGFGVAIGIMAKSLKTLSSLNIEEIGRGLVGLGGILLELATYMKLTQNLSINPGMAVGLTAIATSLGLLIPPLLIFALIPFERLIQAVGALGVILGELALFSKLADKSLELIATGAAITLLSGGILILSGAVAALAMIPLENTIQGLGGLLAILAELTAAMWVIGKLDYKSLLGGAAAISAMALALVPLSISFLAFSVLDLAAIGKGILAMGAALAEINTAIIAVSKLGGGAGGFAAAASIALLANSLLGIVPVFAALGSMSLPSIGKGLLAIGAGLGILVGAGYLATPAAVGIVAIGASLTALTVGIGVLVGGIGGLVNGLGTLATAFVAFSAMSREEAEKAGQNMVIFLRSIAEGITKSEAVFATGFLTLFSTMVDAVSQTIPSVLEAIASALLQIADLIVQYTPLLLDAIMSFLWAVKDVAFEFGEVAALIVIEFVEGVCSGIAQEVPTIIDALGKAFEEIVAWLWDAVKGLGPTLLGAAKTVGQDIGNGIINGLKSLKNKIFGASEEVGQESIEGLRSGIDAHSPSALADEIMREDFGDGVSNGLFKAIPKVKKSAISVAVDGVLNPIKETLNQNGGGEGLSKNFLQTIIDGITSKTPEVSTSAANTAGTASDAAINTAKKKKIGSTAASHVAKEIDEDKKLEEAAKKKAEEVADIFSTEFKKIDLNLSNIGYEFDIWKAIQGPEANEGVIKSGELALAEKQLKEYAKQYQIAFDNYQYLVNNPDLVQSPTELAEKQNEYMKYLTQMYTQAEKIAEMQKEISDDYKVGIEVAREEILQLQSTQAGLLPKDFEFSDETKAAYENFLNATTEDAKQRYYDIWKELSDLDYSNALGGLPKINADEIKKEVFNELGLDPNNPLDGYIDVQETVSALVGETATAYLQGLESAYPTVIGTYGDIIAEGTEKALDEAKSEYPEFKTVGKSMVSYTASGIREEGPAVTEAGIEVTEEARQEVSQTTTKWQEVGLQMMKGIQKGIADGRSEVINEAVEVALAALAAAKSALGIASPSKKFKELGVFTGLGFALGIANSKEDVVDEATNVADAAADAIFGYGKLVQDMFDNDFNPVLRPVLDLSSVERNISRIDELWSETGRKITSDISVSELERAAQSVEAAKREPTVVNYNETFTQNNYSPKSLSAIDIYRQTHNQLNMGRRNINK